MVEVICKSSEDAQKFIDWVEEYLEVNLDIRDYGNSNYKVVSQHITDRHIAILYHYYLGVAIQNELARLYSGAPL